jgi:6-phosphogluconolactonase
MIVSMDASLEIRIADDSASLAEIAAHEIVSVARAATAARGRFTVALAGGSTPRATYRRLAQPPLAAQMPWDRTLVFFGDERGVPPNHEDSNYGMAHAALLAHVPIPPERVFRIRGEGSDPDAVAADYARALGEALGVRRGEMPRLDLILLGLGIDAAVHAAAASVPQRFTLTYPVLNAAACVIYIVSGAEKAKIVKAALADHATAVPAAMVRPSEGRLLWMLDRGAAASLPPRRMP